jgi:hypothetical protein
VIERAGDAAERTVLTSVGATLTARDAVVEFVGTYSDPNKVQREVERRLKTFERRGTTARRNLERELKRTRTRVEREVRQRTNRVERDVKVLRTDAQRVGKDVGRFSRDTGATSVAQQVTLVGTRVENVAQGAALGATKVARVATGRVASLV